MFSDLSAGVDVYSDWIDACDAVAKDAADPDDPADGDGMESYHDLDTGIDHRNSQIQVDQHLVSAMEENDDFQDDFDES